MARVFFGGVPTAPDVRLLRERYPALQGGDEVSYAEIEQVIGVKHGTSHFRSVVKAWRSALHNDLNIDTVAVPGAGIRCLMPNERVDASFKTFREGIRKAGRGVRRAATIRPDSVSGADAKRLEHLQLYGGRLVRDATVMIKEVALPGPAEQNPRRRLGDES
jgi:hypothetical protein